mgnify:CR=1 FL=1
MKKLTFLLFAFLFVSTLCFAQQAQAPVSQPTVSQTAQTPVITKTLTGKVDSVIIGDTTKGTKSELVVVADDGKKLSFVVKNGTPINDKVGITVALNDIKKDTKVTVGYTMNEMGTHKAQSIKLVE